MNIEIGIRVYVAGCGGMLGDAMYARLKSVGAVIKATDINCIESWIEFGDVRDLTAIRKSIVEFAPDLIVNLAALTNRIRVF